MSQINMEAFKHGDDREFEKIISTYNGELKLYALKLTKNTQEAEDIVIGAFNKLFARCSNFDTLTNIQGFLYITVRNDCLNAIKKQDRLNTLKKEIIISHGNAQAPEVLLKMIEGDIQKKLLKAIESLPPTCRQIYKLHFFEQKSNAEIAELLGLKLNNVINQISIARKRLRRLI